MNCDVIIPCYNAAPFLRQTIESALSQTRPPSEIIVVDDGSTDGSVEVASSFGSPVRVVRQTNAGECAARNRGIDEARSAWVAFLDADDVWQPTKLERQFEALARCGEAVCVHTDYYVFGSQATGERECFELPAGGRYPVERLIVDPLIHPSTAMVRRTISNRFPVGVRQGGDMLFFASLALAPEARFAHVAEPLAGYRLHPRQVTREDDAWVTHLQNRFRWVADMEPRLGPERSESLRAVLRRQVVEWIHLARWTRQWHRYRGLKLYAASLDWPGAPPKVIGERTLPAVCYTVKDWIDDFRRRPRARTNDGPTANHLT